MNGLPDSLKMGEKGVILVRGPWDETPGSPELPFDINRSQSFPGVCVGGRFMYAYTCGFMRD